jgi:hypothetical protein
MAFDAVLEVPNALFQMLRSDILQRMRMTTVTGVLAVVVLGVTDDALDIVIAVKVEVFVVIKRGRLPAFV